MKYEGDIGLYLSGAQVPIPQCGIFIEQPKIKQIVQFGEANFLTALQILSDTSTFVSQIKKGNSQLEEYNDFQVLLVVIKQDQSVQSYIEAFFELVCPTYKLTFQKNSIEFTLKEDEDNTSIKGVLNPFNYEYFSKVIKELFGIPKGEGDYDPANEKAAEIAEKLRKGKQIAQEAKGVTVSEYTSLFGTYISILAVGMSMDINIFYSYTPFQIFDTFKRYWAKIQSDFYQKVSTTPMMDVSKVEAPEEWTRNLY